MPEDSTGIKNYACAVTIRNTLLCSLLLATGCAGAHGTPATNPWSGLDLDCESYSISIGDEPSLEIVNGHGRFSVTRKGGRLAVARDGREVAPALVAREADLIRVAGEDGTTVLMFGMFGPARTVTRQLVYSPDIDPATVNRRYGFAVERLDARGGRQTGLDPEAVAVVAKICPQGPAAEGGLLVDDIIVRADGSAPVTALELARKAVSKSEGATLRLTVHRGGRESDVSLTSRHAPQWPAPAEAESHLRRAVDH